MAQPTTTTTTTPASSVQSSTTAPAANTPVDTTQITQPMPSQEDRESIAKSLEALAASFRQGHADTGAHEHAQNLQKKGVLDTLKSFMPLFIAGQAKAVKERDSKK